MEIKLSRKTKPNKSRFTPDIKSIFRKPWDKLCENKAFARFAYVTFPAHRKKAAGFLVKHRKRIAIPALAGIVVLVALSFLMVKDSINSDYLSEGDDSVEYAMVLQNYSTFDHSEKTRAAVRLSWTDGAINLNGGTAQARIKAKIYPVNLENQEITWTSSDEEIAQIDENGKITALNPGEVSITATLESEGKSADAALAVRQPVTGIFLPTSTVTLYTGSIGRLLQTKIFPENATNKNIVWKSKNTKVARVDSSGHVKPVSVGMTEITATTEDGSFEGKCFVNVINPSVDVQTISVQNAADMKLKVGDSINAIVTVSPSNARNKTLKWSSDNTAVASVSQIGRIRGVGEGTANITVESTNGKTQTFSVEIIASDERDPFDMTNIGTDVPGLETAGTVTYTPYNTTFPQAVRIQMEQNPPPKIWRAGGSSYASEAETAEYMNPSSYFEDEYKYQFLDLSKPNNVSVESMNKFLADKGILRGTGEAFIEAAREYNVSEIYLAVHACLETGNGTSQLSCGVEVNGTVVYNMFGIAAYDNSALYSGSQKAYKEGWTTVESAIKGGAKWISDYYINSSDGRQNTLYKMRWNPENPGEHQYATDIGWAVKQAVSMGKLFESFPEAVLSFDVPVYSGQIPPTISAE